MIAVVFVVAVFIYGQIVTPTSPTTSVPTEERTHSAPALGCERVEVFFCPEDGCSAKIIALIDRANESIDVAIYSFTHREIAKALIDAKDRGVAVRVLMEGEQLSRFSVHSYLKNSGIEVRMDGNPYLMHNKFMVIDDRIVIGGSFNYSYSADRKNNENVIVIYGSETASEFEKEFEKLWGSGKPIG